MKEKRIPNALRQADKRYREEAAPGRRTSGRPGWIGWAAAAACLGLIAGVLFVIFRPGKTRPDIYADLPQIAIPAYENGGMGFEGLMYYSAEELENGNPWREDMALETLPVFRNGSYDPSGAGVPIGLNEAEMTAELEKAAEALGLEILGVETETDETKSGDGTVIPGETAYAVRATTDNGGLTVYANSRLVYDLPQGHALPAMYRFTYHDTSDAEAAAVMAYLTETYASFLNFGHPVTALQGDYTFSGDYIRRYLVYDAGSDAVESILNYCFRMAQFAPDDSGNLMAIGLNDGLRMAEKLGDYPLISPAEAKEKLLNGNYQTSVPVGMPGEEYIAKTELIYRTGPGEEILLPYYRFYAELKDGDGWQMTQRNGLKTYGAYYVPAVQDAYISDMPTYDGHFN